jgi:hypothetical protein
MNVNIASPSRVFQGVIVLLLAAVLPNLAGCNFSFEQDPATTVTVEISGISDEGDREQVEETLKGMTDGSSHSIASSWSGDKMTVNLSPVGDVQAFSRKINFGEVTEVDGRTVKVKFVE